MELVNDFTVNVPVDEAWVTLTDVERIAPCLPGAQLQEIEGDTYRGVVKIKVGPIVAQFKGQAIFVEKDEVNHRAVLKAEGRDTGGKGNASALITAQLTSKGEGSTYVEVTTDLTITGKVAQFGRGALADVSNKLLGQFVDNLETTVLNEPRHETAATTADVASEAVPDAVAAPAAAPAQASSSSAAAEQPTVRKIESKEVAPLDLVDAAGGAMVKRLLPLGILAIVLVLILRRRRS
jgi:carbon monoxide dehydrogenase subunit G